MFTRRFLLKYADGPLLRPLQLKLHDSLHSELHDYCHLKTLNCRDETFAASTLLILHVFSFIILVYRKDLGHKQTTKEEKGGTRKLKKHRKEMWKEGRVKDNKVVSKKKQGGMSIRRTFTAHYWAFQPFIWS